MLNDAFRNSGDIVLISRATNRVPNDRPQTKFLKNPSVPTGSGLSNCDRQLAKLVGTMASVICRLEDADYEGHSLAMLNRIAAAMKRRVEIRFVPEDRRVKSA